MRITKFHLAWVMSLIFWGCPITQKQAPAPCSDQSECLPGFECRTGNCIACDKVCETNFGEGVGPRGAIVCGADNVCLHFPPNALAQPQNIFVEKLDVEPSIPNTVLLSAAYSAQPEGLVLDTEIRIEIPITSSASASRISVFQASSIDGPWEKLVGTSTSVTAIGSSNTLSIFAAGFEQN